MNRLTSVGDVASVIDCEHRTAPRSEIHAYGFSVGTRDVRRGLIDLRKAKPVSRSTFGEWTRRAVPRPGDLIFSREAPVGEVGEVPDGAIVCLGQRTVLLQPDRTRVVTRYLKHALMDSKSQEWIHANSLGSTVLHLNVKDVRRIPIRYLPNLTEQRRIVDILEDHLSRLDAVDAYLTAANRRASVFMGSLLSNARCGEFVNLADVADIQGGIQKQQSRAPRDNAYPFLRVANVTSHGLDLSDVHQIGLFGGELDRLRLRKGDLLVVEGNGSPSQIGRAALWDGSIENCVHQNHLIRVRARTGLMPGYLEAVWNSPETRAVLSAVSSSSSGLHTLSVSKLKQIRVPLPDLDEQLQGTSALREGRDAQARLVAQLGEAKARSIQLRRATLAAAFSGKLTGRHTDQEEIEQRAPAADAPQSERAVTLDGSTQSMGGDHGVHGT